MPKLIIRPGTPQAHEFELKAGKNYVGRGFANDLKLDDASVSGNHALIEVAGNIVTITDLGSTNGTRINQLPATQNPLQSGQMLRLGGVELLFMADVGVSPAPPAVTPLSSAAAAQIATDFTIREPSHIGVTSAAPPPPPPPAPTATPVGELRIPGVAPKPVTAPAPVPIVSTPIVPTPPPPTPIPIAAALGAPPPSPIALSPIAPTPVPIAAAAASVAPVPIAPKPIAPPPQPVIVSVPPPAPVPIAATVIPPPPAPIVPVPIPAPAPIPIAAASVTPIPIAPPPVVVAPPPPPAPIAPRPAPITAPPAPLAPIPFPQAPALISRAPTPATSTAAPLPRVPEKLISSAAELDSPIPVRAAPVRAETPPTPTSVAAAKILATLQATSAAAIAEPPPAKAPAPTPPSFANAEPPPGITACKFHRNNPGQWLCPKCNLLFCSLCVGAQPTPSGVGYFCRTCGTQCAPVKVKVISKKEKKLTVYSDATILMRILGFGSLATIISGGIWIGLATVMGFPIPALFMVASGAACGLSIKLASQDRPGTMFTLSSILFYLLTVAIGEVGSNLIVHMWALGFPTYAGFVGGIFLAWKIGGGDF